MNITKKQYDRLEELENMDEDSMTESDFEEMEELAEIAINSIN